MLGAASTGAQRTGCVREHRMRSGNAADGRSWTGLQSLTFFGRDLYSTATYRPETPWCLASRK